MNERLHSEEKVLLAIEMSNTKWQLLFTNSRDSHKRRGRVLEAGSGEALMVEIQKAREKYGMPEAKVVCCYEAGRDGFWLHRYLMSHAVECLVVDSSSIKTDQRQKRIKTDGVDAERLLEQLIDHCLHGKPDALRVVRVPSEDVESIRRMERERGRLIKEQTAHRARIRSLLVLLGIRVRAVSRHACEKARDWRGKELSGEVRAEVLRELDRLELLEEQVAQVNAELNRRLKDPQTSVDAIAAMLAVLKGVGAVGAHLLAREVFWRHFRNRREVGSYVGLTGCPYNSGSSTREQGVSKAGNKRARALMVELAWQWLRFQPSSGLSHWFAQKTGNGTKRTRRVYVVALARKLLVALWKWLATCELPQGAVIKRESLAALA